LEEFINNKKQENKSDNKFDEAEYTPDLSVVYPLGWEAPIARPIDYPISFGAQIDTVACTTEEGQRLFTQVPVDVNYENYHQVTSSMSLNIQKVALATQYIHDGPIIWNHSFRGYTFALPSGTAAQHLIMEVSAQSKKNPVASNCAPVIVVSYKEAWMYYVFGTHKYVDMIFKLVPLYWYDNQHKHLVGTLPMYGSKCFLCKGTYSCLCFSEGVEVKRIEASTLSKTMEARMLARFKLNFKPKAGLGNLISKAFEAKKTCRTSKTSGIFPERKNECYIRVGFEIPWDCRA